MFPTNARISCSRNLLKSLKSHLTISYSTTVGVRLRELHARYAFAGVFLDKIRLPSPANGVDEMLSCFCDHCRGAAAFINLDLDSVVKILADRAIDPGACPARTGGGEASHWLEALLAGDRTLSLFFRFRAGSVTRPAARGISTFCRSAMLSALTSASGSTPRPQRRSSSAYRLASEPHSTPPKLHSAPRKTFSAHSSGTRWIS